MGLRSRLKSRVKKAMGRNEPAPPPEYPPTVTAPNGTAPASTATPKPKLVAVPPAPAPKATPAPKKPAKAAKAGAGDSQPAAVEPESADEAARKQAKIAKHREKTRKAVIKKLIELGGESDLGPLHDYSERRYFVAHRAFSELMEGLVAEDLLLFDHSTGIATITQGGRDYVA